MSAVWRSVLRLAGRQLLHNHAASIFSPVAMALPVSAVVAAAVIVPNQPPRYTPSEIAGVDPTSIKVVDPAVNDYWVSYQIGTVTSFAVLALVFIVAMVAAALLVTVRRDERMLATLASIGAPPRALFALVSLRGVFLGLLAAIIAVFMGLVAGTIVLIVSNQPVKTVAVGVIVTSALVTVLVGWVASLVAAVRASRLDVTAVLRDAPKPRKVAKAYVRNGCIMMLFGAGLMLAVGIVGAIFLPQLATNEDSPQRNLASIVFFVVETILPIASGLILIGAAFALPAIFQGIAALVRQPGSPIRFAARNAPRGGARTFVVSSSIMIVCSLFSFSLVFNSIFVAYFVGTHSWQFQKNQVGIDLVYVDEFAPEIPTDSRKTVVTGRSVLPEEDIKAIEAAIHETFEVSESRVLDGALGPYWGEPLAVGSRGYQPMPFPDAGLPQPQIAQNGVCSEPFSTTGLNKALCRSNTIFELSPERVQIWVGDARDLALILGKAPDAATLDALDSGAAIALDPRYLSSERTVTIEWWGKYQFIPQGQPGEFLPTGTPLRSHTFTAHLVTQEHRIDFGVFMSKQAADRAGLTVVPARFLAHISIPSDQQRDLATYAVGQINGRLFLNLELGAMEQEPQWGLVAAVAALTFALAFASLGLSRIEGHRTDETLAALGATLGLRRRINAWYAVFVVGVSAVVGTLIGLGCIATMFYILQTDWPLVWPIAELALIILVPLLVVPAIAFLLPVRGLKTMPRSD